jgi:hypothetical protein
MCWLFYLKVYIVYVIFLFSIVIIMDEIRVIDANMPDEVWIKWLSDQDENQTNQVLDNILCDD